MSNTYIPLAKKMRPSSLDDIVGQDKITGKDGIVRKMLETNSVRSCIFYGSPGCGKSATAKILAEQSGIPFVWLNATTASVTDIKNAVKDNQQTLIYLDEIQYFNKKQQQSLLSFIEDGSVILIAATTENPYHGLYKALLSRCLIIEFQPVPRKATYKRLQDALLKEGLTNRLTDETVLKIAYMASGDLRKAWNITEVLLDRYTNHPITPEEAQDIFPTTNMGSFDLDGEQHYRYKAALQKSIRGSDPDAAVFWLMQMLEGGDIISPSRRMIVMASEDVGMADPLALPIVMACVNAAERVGLPEARYPLSQAAIYLATAPKANSIGQAFSAAVNDIHNGYGTVVPEHIASEHPKNYIYPHPYKNHWVDQQYMPDDLLDKQYYKPQHNPQEQGRAAYWAKVKKNNE